MEVPMSVATIAASVSLVLCASEKPSLEVRLEKGTELAFRYERSGPKSGRGDGEGKVLLSRTLWEYGLRVVDANAEGELVLQVKLLDRKDLTADGSGDAKAVEPSAAERESLEVASAVSVWAKVSRYGKVLKMAGAREDLQTADDQQPFTDRRRSPADRARSQLWTQCRDVLPKILGAPVHGIGLEPKVEYRDLPDRPEVVRRVDERPGGARVQTVGRNVGYASPYRYHFAGVETFEGKEAVAFDILRKRRERSGTEARGGAGKDSLEAEEPIVARGRAVFSEEDGLLLTLESRSEDDGSGPRPSAVPGAGVQGSALSVSESLRRIPVQKGAFDGPAKDSAR
jgi:hypothetical protein